GISCAGFGPLFRGSGTAKQPDSFASGVVATGDIALHHRRVPLGSGPITAAAGRLHRDPISRSQHVTFALREMRRRRSDAALTDGNLVDGAGAATEKAGRSDPTVIHQKRGFRLAPQESDLVVDPETAAMPSRTSRTFAQGKPVEQDRVMLLENLDWLCLRDAD